MTFKEKDLPVGWEIEESVEPTYQVPSFDLVIRTDSKETALKTAESFIMSRHKIRERIAWIKKELSLEVTQQQSVDLQWWMQVLVDMIGFENCRDILEKKE